MWRASPGIITHDILGIPTYSSSKGNFPEFCDILFLQTKPGNRSQSFVNFQRAWTPADDVAVFRPSRMFLEELQEVAAIL